MPQVRQRSVRTLLPNAVSCSLQERREVGCAPGSSAKPKMPFQDLSSLDQAWPAFAEPPSLLAPACDVSLQALHRSQLWSSVPLSSVPGLLLPSRQLLTLLTFSN